jgi:hypothetical protein
MDRCSRTLIALGLIAWQPLKAQHAGQVADDSLIVYRVFGHPPPLSMQCAEAIVAKDMGFEWRSLGSGCVRTEAFADSITVLNQEAEVRLIDQHGTGFWDLFHERAKVEASIVAGIDSLVRRTSEYERALKIAGTGQQVIVWVGRGPNGGYIAEIIPVRPAPSVLGTDSRLYFDRNAVRKE